MTFREILVEFPFHPRLQIDIIKKILTGLYRKFLFGHGFTLLDVYYLTG
jgi:hypothetical protein